MHTYRFGRQYPLPVLLSRRIAMPPLQRVLFPGRLCARLKTSSVRWVDVQQEKGRVSRWLVDERAVSSPAGGFSGTSLLVSRSFRLLSLYMGRGGVTSLCAMLVIGQGLVSAQTALGPIRRFPTFKVRTRRSVRCSESTPKEPSPPSSVFQEALSHRQWYTPPRTAAGRLPACLRISRVH